MGVNMGVTVKSPENGLKKPAPGTRGMGCSSDPSSFQEPHHDAECVDPVWGPLPDTLP